MARIGPPIPNRFIEARVHLVEPLPGLSGLCAGYESGQWRCTQLAAHLMEWLPEFALKWSEWIDLSHYNAIGLLRRAATVVYTTDKYAKRGEFGELILHAALRQLFDTVPAISKLYFKDSENETVKGFDAVHVVVSDEELELWLGEAKFYSDIRRAIGDAVEEVILHTDKDYLRSEFALIRNKIDAEWPYSSRLDALIDPNTSLDDVFARICIPVLLTYNSEVVSSFVEVSEEYELALENEVRTYHAIFCETEGLPDLRIHLVLFPLGSKSDLVEALNDSLQAMQTI
ncbi:DUF1837 domain-containing protein [Gemmatimonadota bacterium]